MASIIIQKYGPISNAQIEFAPMVIITGNSNLGKSYVNYLLYYLVRSTSAVDLTEFFISKGLHQQMDFYISIEDIQAWMNQRVESFMRDFLNSPDLVCEVTFQLSADEKKSFHIQCKEDGYENNQYNKSNELLISEQTKLVQVIIDGRFTGIYKAEGVIRSSAVETALSRELQKYVFGTIISHSVILPPARGAFVGENYTLKQAISSSVGMYRHFLRDYDTATTMVANSYDRPDRIYIEMVQKLIGGRLLTKDGTQYLEMTGGKIIPLSAAASSIKELSPFLMMLQSLRSNSSPLSFCIEEPEAHLHPSMQIELADILAACRNRGMFFQMTTHSDYFMQRINQLLRLGDLRNKHADLYERTAEENGWSNKSYLNQQDLACYYFNQDDAGDVSIEKLEIQDCVLPMSTFFDSMNRLSDIESVLNALD